ncbi:MAG: plastocyanin/azurin family copper-binding protein [Actinomycetota bacterium]|nr:plastocyanin/azurin family copper-binding protein [Actinomycetota bacterium]
MIAVAAVGLSTACGGGDGGSGGDEASAPGTDAVTMELIAFRPETLSVGVGATVTWTQKDAGVHTVTSGTVEQGGGGVTKAPDGRFDSGELATGETFTFTFDRPGTYPYFCAVHPATMRGEVRVG